MATTVDPYTGEVLGEVDEHPTADESATYERTDLEERAQTSSLDELQTRRRLLMERNARLFALYGNFGLFDDYRKKMVEAQKIRVRMDLSVGAEKKPTEAAIDAGAYGSEEYGRFLDNALSEKVDYLKIATEITEIEEQIRSREIEMRAYSAEISLR